MPKVSIIIPFYNTEKYIGKCLETVVNQTLDDIEVICVNDCSTDNSLDVVYDFANKDKRIKVINNPLNMKQGASRNIGIKMATGEYIGFIDSDDWIDLDYFEKLYVAVKKHNPDANPLDPSIHPFDNRTLGCSVLLSRILPPLHSHIPHG